MSTPLSAYVTPLSPPASPGFVVMRGGLTDRGAVVYASSPSLGPPFDVVTDVDLRAATSCIVSAIVETLVLFAKSPVAGSSKTRLAKDRGGNDAVILSAGFLLDTAALCARWRSEKVAVDQNRRVAGGNGVDPVAGGVAGSGDKCCGHGRGLADRPARRPSSG